MPQDQVYCVRKDVTDIIAQHTADAYSDDLENRTPDTKLIDAQIKRAAMKINMYLASRFRLDDIAAVPTTPHPLANYFNATMAAYYVAGRRFNSPPDSLRQDFEDAVEDLKEIKSGNLPLIEQPESFQHRPMVTNYRIERWRGRHGGRNPQRVVPEESTGRRPLPPVKNHQIRDP